MHDIGSPFWGDDSIILSWDYISEIIAMYIVSRKTLLPNFWCFLPCKGTSRSLTLWAILYPLRNNWGLRVNGRRHGSLRSFLCFFFLRVNCLWRVSYWERPLRTNPIPAGKEFSPVPCLFVNLMSLGVQYDKSYMLADVCQIF